MHKKFEINQTRIKGGYQFGRKVVPHDSKSDLPLVYKLIYTLTHEGGDRWESRYVTTFKNMEKHEKKCIVLTHHLVLLDF